MAKLTAAARKAIPTKSFALPGRRYPIEDAAHARNALARVSQHGSAHEKAEVRAAVHHKFPGIGRHHKGAAHGHGSGPVPPQHPGRRPPVGPNIGDEHHAHHPNMHDGHSDHEYLNRHLNKIGESFAPDYEDKAHVKD